MAVVRISPQPKVVGYSGAVTATTTAPFYTSTIADVACPSGFSGTVPGSNGTGGTSGCTVEAGYSAGAVTATSTTSFYTVSTALVAPSDCPTGRTLKLEKENAEMRARILVHV